MPLNTTGGKIYLVSINDPEQICEMQFVPQELHVNRATDLQHIQILGENFTRFHYLSGGKDIEFEVDFFADFDSKLQIVDKLLLLEAWTMNEGFSKAPPRLSLIWGELSQTLATENIWILKGFKYVFTSFDKETALPRQARCRLELSYEPSKRVNASNLIKNITDLKFGHGGY